MFTLGSIELIKATMPVASINPVGAPLTALKAANNKGLFNISEHMM